MTKDNNFSFRKNWQEFLKTIDDNTIHEAKKSLEIQKDYRVENSINDLQMDEMEDCYL